MASPVSTSDECVAWLRQLLVHSTFAPPPSLSLLVDGHELGQFIEHEALGGLTLWHLDQLARQQELAALPSPWQQVRDRLQASAAERLAKTMLYEHEARVVVERLAAAGIRCLLLKGVAVAQWAYPASHLREYCDVDLVVPGYAEALQAANILKQAGYTWVKTTHPLVGYELLCRRETVPGYAVEIDVHWSASGTALTRHALPFDLLWQDSRALPSLGPHARGLSPVHAFLQACINRTTDVLNGERDRSRILYDLVALPKLFSAHDWKALCHLCSQQRVAGFVIDAMQHATQVWQATWPTAAFTALLSAQSTEPFRYDQLRNWRYTQGQQFRRQKGLINRLLWLWHRSVPSHETLRFKHDPSMQSVHVSYFRLLIEHILLGTHKLTGKRHGQ